MQEFVIKRPIAEEIGGPGRPGKDKKEGSSKGRRMRLLIALLCLLPSLLWAQDSRQEQMRKLAWQAGPIEGRISDKATIKVPAGYVFLDEKNTSRFLELTGNPPRGGHYLFAPDTFDWWSVFAFDASGYEIGRASCRER